LGCFAFSIKLVTHNSEVSTVDFVVKLDPVPICSAKTQTGD
jgi:hypothetical protein